MKYFQWIVHWPSSSSSSTVLFHLEWNRLPALFRWSGCQKFVCIAFCVNIFANKVEREGFTKMAKSGRNSTGVQLNFSFLRMRELKILKIFTIVAPFCRDDSPLRISVISRPPLLLSQTTWARSQHRRHILILKLKGNNYVIYIHMIAGQNFLSQTRWWRIMSIADISCNLAFFPIYRCFTWSINEFSVLYTLNLDIRGPTIKFLLCGVIAVLGIQVEYFLKSLSPITL